MSVLEDFYRRKRSVERAVEGPLKPISRTQAEILQALAGDRTNKRGRPKNNASQRADRIIANARKRGTVWRKIPAMVKRQTGLTITVDGCRSRLRRRR